MLKYNISAVIQLIITLTLGEFVLSDVLVYNRETHNIEIVFKDVPSRFGDPIPMEGIRGMVVYSKPADACTAIEKPPPFENFTGRWIVLVKRYNCTFEEKVRNAQKAGYQAAIVHNVNSSYLEPMNADNPYGIHIPSVFIGSESGLLLKENYLYEDGYYVLINDEAPNNFTPYLLLVFSILIGFCFLVMIVFIIVKYFKERRRQRRHRLPKSSLKKIAVHKFKKNDPYEVCAICLEEYVENDKLRVLPCSHAYHSKCIDPWLTKNRRVCPVCKRKVFATGEVITDTDTDTDDETAPLVRNSATPNNAGTFARQTENPFSRYFTQTRTHPVYLPSSSSGSSDSNASNNPFRREVTIQVRSQPVPVDPVAASSSSSDSSRSSPVNSRSGSMPEMSRPPFQSGMNEDVRNLIEEPSINSAGNEEAPNVRVTTGNSILRNLFSL